MQVVLHADEINQTTGFLGSGKTTVILGLLPHLPVDYKVVLLKNEFGDVEGRENLLSFYFELPEVVQSTASWQSSPHWRQLAKFSMAACESTQP